MLKLKLQYFSHLMWRVNTSEKTLMLGKNEGKKRRGQQMVRWHHWLNGHEFEKAPGDDEGQGSLACCSPWGRRVGHDWATEQKGDCVNGGEIFSIHMLLSFQQPQETNTAPMQASWNAQPSLGTLVNETTLTIAKKAWEGALADSRCPRIPTNKTTEARVPGGLGGSWRYVEVPEWAWEEYSNRDV